MMNAEKLALVAKHACLSLERVEAALRVGRQGEDWAAVSRAMREVAEAERATQPRAESQGREGALFIARE